jgi:hypothetical protein
MSALQVEFPCNGVCVLISIRGGGVFIGSWGSSTNLAEAVTDVDINTSDTSTPTHNQIFGLITQACARQLNNQVSLFLASYSSYLDNGNMCSVLLLRNDGQRNGVAFTLAAFRFQNSSSL